MSQRLEAKLGVLPAAQRQIWASLAAAPELNLVLYGGTAIALHLGHRESLDFDFFCSEPLDKDRIRAAFGFVKGGAVLQDGPNTLAVLASMPSGPVRVSFFGGIGFGRVNDPLPTSDGVLLTASLDDLMATKLKAILDRAEAKDYLPVGLGAFRAMFDGEPAQVLRALGYFGDGDLRTLPLADQQLLRQARDRVGTLPKLALKPGPLTGHARLQA
jgi:hypothetical protein